MRWLLWCFCLLAESYETINHWPKWKSYTPCSLFVSFSFSMLSKRILSIIAYYKWFAAQHTASLIRILILREPFFVCKHLEPRLIKNTISQSVFTRWSTRCAIVSTTSLSSCPFLWFSCILPVIACSISDKTPSTPVSRLIRVVRRLTKIWQSLVKFLAKNFDNGNVIDNIDFSIFNV